MKIQPIDETESQPDSIIGNRAYYIALAQKGIGIVRILFGVAWAIAASLKWQPAFIHSFAATIESANQSQPAIVQAWSGFWLNMVHANPTSFAVMAATVESILALCFIFGVFSNTASLLGIVWAFVVWSVPEGFGTPYIPGQSTDMGTAFPYLLLCVLLLLLRSGRYLGIDRFLTQKLGRLGFLAAGPL